MDDPFLMGVLNGGADLREELQSGACRQFLAVAIVGDGDARNVLHDKVRPAVDGGTGIEHRGDVRMVHERHGLAFRLEPRDHLARVHAELDDFEGDPTPERLFLLGQIDDAHTAFAERLEDLVRADLATEKQRRRY